MTSTFALTSLFTLLIFGAPAPGPLGEGLVAPDTLILLADGTTKKAEDLAKGDQVRVWDDTHDVWTSTPVKSVVRNNLRSYWVLKTSKGVLRGSANLWVATTPSRLARLDSFTTESSVLGYATKGPVAEPVTGVREYPTNLALYNIDLEKPGLLLASGLLIHD